MNFDVKGAAQTREGAEGKVGERDCKQDNQCLFKYKLCGSKVGGEEESGRLLQLIAQLTFV